MKYPKIAIFFLLFLALIGYPMIAGYLNAGMLSVLIVLVAPFVHFNVIEDTYRKYL